MNGRLKLEQLTKGFSDNKSNVIIACVHRNIIGTFFFGWERLNLGFTMSKRLMNIDKSSRKQALPSVAREIVQNIQSNNIVIYNIDFLFSPQYSLDVIKLFIMASSNKNLIVLWEGGFKNGMITYSKPGYKDYHIYDINSYNVHYII